MPVSSAPKAMDFPYGMSMNISRGQVGPSAGVMDTNSLVVSPTYTTPVTSVPQTHDIYNSGYADRISELDGFEALYASVAYGPGVPSKGTAEPNHIPPYVFN